MELFPGKDKIIVLYFYVYKNYSQEILIFGHYDFILVLSAIIIISEVTGECLIFLKLEK